jgi:hypothetical protein
MPRKRLHGKYESYKRAEADAFRLLWPPNGIHKSSVSGLFNAAVTALTGMTTDKNLPDASLIPATPMILISKMKAQNEGDDENRHNGLIHR